MQDAEYLLATWHAQARHETLKADITAGFTDTRWLGLTVFAEANGQSSQEGYVSFVARFEAQGHESAIIERSRFLKESGRWYYIDGTRPQLGRNDPCPCGAGNKFKKCCGR